MFARSTLSSRTPFGLLWRQTEPEVRATLAPKFPKTHWTVCSVARRTCSGDKLVWRILTRLMFVAVVSLLSTPAAAEDPVLYGNAKSWKVYSSSEADKIACVAYTEYDRTSVAMTLDGERQLGLFLENASWRSLRNKGSLLLVVQFSYRGNELEKRTVTTIPMSAALGFGFQANDDAFVRLFMVADAIRITRPNGTQIAYLGLDGTNGAIRLLDECVVKERDAFEGR